jgi:outer membrane protein OmpA-like peptidoglycan-associated protein
MKIIKQYILSALLLMSFSSVAQYNIVLEESNADCNNAIDISGNLEIIATAPIGKGGKSEIESQKGDLFYFEKEHNVVWYKIIAIENAFMSFDIIPEKASDDYDFILFECGVDDCCNAIANKSIKPIRTNISRTRIEEDGRTGLSENGITDFVKEGKGNNYSNIVELKKGITYYLVLDNVYGGNGGHRIKFTYKKKEVKPIETNQAKLKLNIVDSKSKELLSADIIILSYDKNYKADTIYNGRDSSLFIPVEMNGYYEILATKQNYLKNKISFRVGEDSITEKTLEIKNVEVGSSFELKKVYFVGGTATFTGSSQKALRKLYYVMKNNPNLKVEIQGHVNLPNGRVHKYSEEYYNQLSIDRAKAVYDYLIKRGISEYRLKYKGFGYSQMLFPNATTASEMEKNRRVELRVTGN